MSDKKKPWTEPELIVLVRKMPEETVLTVCKFKATFSLSPTAGEWHCNVLRSCVDCSGFSAS